MNHYKFDSLEIIRQTEKLVDAASNRYQITVQVARRANHCEREVFDDDYSSKKSVIRAITEMSDEQSEELIGDQQNRHS